MRARAQNAVGEPRASSFDADLELKQLVHALGVDVDTLVGRPDVETVVRDRVGDQRDGGWLRYRRISADAAGGSEGIRVHGELCDGRMEGAAQA